MSRRYVSRAAQAFESLMTPDSDDEEANKSKGKSKKGSGSTSNIGSKVSVGSRSTYTPGFRLKTEPSSQQTSDRNQPNSTDLDVLTDLFGNAFPTDVIQDILQACGGKQEAAIDALLAMTASSSEQEKPAATATADDINSLPSPMPTPPSGTEDPSNLPPNLWDTLPQECKLLILENLSLKDLSKAAATSKEFCSHVRSQRKSLKSIIVPPGLSPRSIRSLVTAFAAATAIDFSRCGKTLRFSNTFEDVAVAVATGASDRPAGSSAAIESISFSKCGELTDGDVASICAVLTSLKGIDISKCSKISDGALKTLARYRRTSLTTGQENNEIEDASGKSTSIDQLEQSLQQTSLESPAEAVERIAAASAAATAARRQSGTALSTSNEFELNGGFEEINVAGTEVTSRGVGELLRGSGKAPYLISLDVSRCPKISGDALVPGPRSLLRVLRASGCTSIRSITLQLSNTGSCLQDIIFTDCKSLKEVIILAAPSLLSLNVSGCTQLTTLSLRCPSLTRVRASGCSRLQIGAVHGAVFECPAVQEINFFGCRALEAAGLEAIIPTLTCLKELDLSGCVALSRIVGVQGQGLRKLRKLVVDGCAVLRHVAVASTDLLELSAKACPRLMEVRIVDSVPRRMDFENCVELREVAIGGGDLIGAQEEEAVAASGIVSSRTGGNKQGTEEGKEMQRKLVLRGCDRLPAPVRDTLRATVLGRGRDH